MSFRRQSPMHQFRGPPETAGTSRIDHHMVKLHTVRRERCLTLLIYPQNSLTKPIYCWTHRRT